MAASSELLRSTAPALASIVICLISLEIGFASIAILSTVLLRCASLIAITLKLTLTILGSLASVSLYESSELSVATLTIIRSTASTQTWGIVIIIIRVFICVGFISLLGFWWVLSLVLRFSFRFSSTSGLFWFSAFERLGYLALFFIHQMCYMGI